MNEYRLKCFGLRDFFTAFFTSRWLGAAKPARRIYELALCIAQAEPQRSLFIDNCERNHARRKGAKPWT